MGFSINSFRAVVPQSQCFLTSSKICTFSPKLKYSIKFIKFLASYN